MIMITHRSIVRVHINQLVKWDGRRDDKFSFSWLTWQDRLCTPRVILTAEVSTGQAAPDPFWSGLWWFWCGLTMTEDAAQSWAARVCQLDSSAGQEPAQGLVPHLRDLGCEGLYKTYRRSYLVLQTLFSNLKWGPHRPRRCGVEVGRRDQWQGTMVEFHGEYQATSTFVVNIRITFNCTPEICSTQRFLVKIVLFDVAWIEPLSPSSCGNRCFLSTRSSRTTFSSLPVIWATPSTLSSAAVSGGKLTTCVWLEIVQDKKNVWVIWDIWV